MNYSLKIFYLEEKAIFLVISLEVRPLAAYYPSPPHKKCAL
jgi:hypothetical protein